MKHNKTKISLRIIIPCLVIAGFMFYHGLDKPNGGAVRWPGVALWIMSGLLIIAYNIPAVIRRQPMNGLFKASIVCFIATGINYWYAVYGLAAFKGLAWYVYVVLPLSVASLVLLFLSLYFGRPSEA